MSRFWTWLTALLLASAAFAQGTPGITRGGALKKRAYQTYATATYYLDPTGSDSNPCVASGTAACLTLNAVYSRIPRIVRHNITINVAAGSYTFDSRWDGLQIGTVNTSGFSGPTITIDGPTLTAFTPATGTASGTLTVAATGSNPLPVFTDGAQTWTVNNLRGQFLTMTSGVYSGRSLPIVENTATTITTQAWSSTNPLAGDTYAIQAPAATITGTHSITGITGTLGTIRLQRLTLTSGAATGAATIRAAYNTANVTLLLQNVQALNPAGSAGAVASNSSAMWSGHPTAGAFYAESVGGIAVSVSSPGATHSSGYFNAYSGASSGYRLSTNAITLPYVNIVAETADAAAVAMNLEGASGSSTGPSFGGIYVRCPVGGTGIGLKLEGGGTWQSSIEVVNCAVGVRIGVNPSNGSPTTFYTPSVISFFLTCTNTTTCVQLLNGGRLHLTPTPTLTGVTNDYIIDGVSYTEAFFGALPSPPRINGVDDSFLKRL